MRDHILEGNRRNRGGETAGPTTYEVDYGGVGMMGPLNMCNM